ncbi:hypothetical protein C8J57DRAFT_1668188 [Mycena rebaudengoi]|nr:hypothetical protein C8J57DRAFT_1668188 [Mycena rebaudengoi]
MSQLCAPGVSELCGMRRPWRVCRVRRVERSVRAPPRRGCIVAGECWTRSFEAWSFSIAGVSEPGGEDAAVAGSMSACHRPNPRHLLDSDVRVWKTPRDLRDLEVDAVQTMAVDAMMQRRQLRAVLRWRRTVGCLLWVAKSGVGRERSGSGRTIGLLVFWDNCFQKLPKSGRRINARDVGEVRGKANVANSKRLPRGMGQIGPPPGTQHRKPNSAEALKWLQQNARGSAIEKGKSPSLHY